MSTEKNEEAVEQSADSTEAFHEPQQQAAVAREWPEQLVVAVDGPSGSGKSSISREVAKRIQLSYLDTGAMYRALTWWCLETGIDPDDEQAVTTAARDFPLEIGTDPLLESIMVSGVDVAEAIREDRVTDSVSSVAKNQGARTELIQRMRWIIETSGQRIVAEGRDITTVVAPDADARILLTASEQARMARRGEQLGGASEEQLEKQVAERDAADSRVVNFTEAADGVTTVDSTELDYEQTVEAVLQAIHAATVQAAEDSAEKDQDSND